MLESSIHSCINTNRKRSECRMTSTTQRNIKKKMIFKRLNHEYPNGALIIKTEGKPDEVIHLKQVSPIELYKMRMQIMKDSKNKCALLIYKVDDKFFIGRIPKNFHVKNAWGVHKCASCENCTAASDDNHGCEKVRNFGFVPNLPDEIVSGPYLLREELKKIKRFEKYPFIREGVELFNIEGGAESFIFKCCNYVEYALKKELSPKERSDLISSMLSLLVDTVRTRNNKVGPYDFW